MNLASSLEPAVASRELWHLFRLYQDRPFVFVRPGGNAGDELIYLGAEKLAKLAGIDLCNMPIDDFLTSKPGRDSVIYIHGGGGYNPFWSGKVMLALERAVGHRGVVIQGPQTYWNDLQFLRERVVKPLATIRCERLVMMAREGVSYRTMEEVLPAGVELLLDHDTALNLQDADLEPFFPRHKPGYRYYAIRGDKEAKDIFPREYFSIWFDPVSPRTRRFDRWIRLHAGARELITNRLHSAICGSILGTPTTLLSNSYFKNRAVWEHSLASRGVHWADRLDASTPSRWVAGFGPSRWVMGQPRVQRLVQRAHGLDTVL
jgi:exopolysaccharide biosynthesis predicted pyruvyltransferase EpsI